MENDNRKICAEPVSLGLMDDYAGYEPRNAERPATPRRGFNWGCCLSMTAYAGGMVGLFMLILDWLR